MMVAFYWICVTIPKDQCYINFAISLHNVRHSLLVAVLFCYRQHCAQRNAPVFKLLRNRCWGFSPCRGDTLHRWRWNLARRRGPKVPGTEEGT